MAPYRDVLSLPKLFAARANNLPLSLHLELGDLVSQNTEIAVCMLLCDPLFSARIRALKISFSGDHPGSVKSILHALSAGDSSNITSLILDIKKRVLFGGEHSRNRLLEDCLLIMKASLRRLAISAPLGWMSERLVPTDLTHLEAVFDNPVELAVALRLCPRLTHLDAMVLHEGVGLVTSQDMKSICETLARLQSLQLRSSNRMVHAGVLIGPAGGLASRIPVLLVQAIGSTMARFGSADPAFEVILLELVRYFEDVGIDGAAMDTVAVTIGGYQLEDGLMPFLGRVQVLTVETSERKRTVVIPADFYATSVGTALIALYSTIGTYSLTSLHVPWEALKDNLFAAPPEQLARVERLIIDFAAQDQSFTDGHEVEPTTSGWESDEDPAGPQAVLAVLGYPGEAPALSALQHLTLNSDYRFSNAGSVPWEFSFGAIDALVGRLTFGTVAPLRTLHLEALNLSEWSDAECRMAQQFAERVSGIKDPDASWRRSLS